MGIPLRQVHLGLKRDTSELGMAGSEKTSVDHHLLDSPAEPVELRCARDLPVGLRQLLMAAFACSNDSGDQGRSGWLADAERCRLFSRMTHPFRPYRIVEKLAACYFLASPYEFSLLRPTPIT
jgi:hypothetical protein